MSSGWFDRRLRRQHVNVHMAAARPAHVPRREFTWIAVLPAAGDRWSSGD
jgi:hypothetical protein